MSMDSLKDLYINELKDLYNAENQLVRALPKMAKKASAPELKRAFQNHLEQTKENVDRLEKIFKGLGEKPTGKTCKAMKGLVEEDKEIIEEDGDTSVLDAALNEEAEADKRLTGLAESIINVQASEAEKNGASKRNGKKPRGRC